MTTLVLVRHGQASFGTRNYDQLSDTGARQAEVLGHHWSATNAVFDEVYTGEMERQRDTAVAALKAAGMAHTPAVRAAFNEYDADTIIRAYLPVLARENPDLSFNKRELFADRRAFQRFYEKVIDLWLRGETHDDAHVESWQAFRERCLAGLRDLAVPGERSTKLVVTSGGVITVALQAALGVDDATAFRLNWRIYNASRHVLRWGRSGLNLHCFNDVTHLELGADAALLTYR